MGLPKHIEEELAQAEEDFKSAYPDQVVTDTQEAEQEPIEAEKEDVATITPDEVVEQETAPAQDVDNTDTTNLFEQRYNVLKGKYNKEVPLLQEQVRNLTSQVETLQNQPAKRSDADEALISKVKDEFGDEFIDDFKQDYSSEQPESEVDALKQRVESAEQATKDIQHESAMAELDRTMPKWREQDSDPLFQEWLGGLDEFSGVVRNELLIKSFKNRDLARVKLIFDAYNVTPTQSQQPQAVQPVETQPQQQKRLMPSASQGTEQAETGKLYSQADIDAFYADVRQGRYRNRAADGERIERDIFAAQNEGRITA